MVSTDQGQVPYFYQSAQNNLHSPAAVEVEALHPPLTADSYLQGVDPLLMSSPPNGRSPEPQSSRSESPPRILGLPEQTKKLMEEVLGEEERKKKKKEPRQDKQQMELQKREQLSKAAEKSSEAAKMRLVTPSGWDQLNSWLKAAEKAGNWTQLHDLLVKCMDMPVTVQLLKRNDTPKLIKRLSYKCPNQEVQAICVDIVSVWKDAVKDQPGKVPESNKKRRSASSVDMNLERESSDDSPDLTKTAARPPPVRELNLFEKFAQEKPANNIEEKNKKRTARVYPTKFRSTGLETDEPTVKKPKPLKEKPLPPPPKKTPYTAAPTTDPVDNILASIPITTDAVASTAAASTTVATTTPAVPKQKPKTTQMIEDTSFMAALAAPTGSAQKIRRKKKTPTAGPTTTTPPSVSPTTPPNPKQSAFFYKDALQKTSSESEKTSMSTRSRKSNGSAKKRVRFVDTDGDGDLVEIHYFEKEECERSVGFAADLAETDMKHLEMRREREWLELARNQHHGEETGDEAFIPWRLLSIDGLVEVIEGGNGINSQERPVETERQKQSLAILFLEADIPEFPREPDTLDRAPKEEPKDIPLDDTGEESSQTASAPAATTTVIAPAVLPPELAQLLQKLNTSGMVPPTAPIQLPLQPPTTTPPQFPPNIPMNPNAMMLAGMMPGMVNPGGMMMPGFGGMPMGMNPRMPKMPGAMGLGGVRIRNIRPMNPMMAPRGPIRPGFGPRFPRSCPYFARGRCTYGTECRFRHVSPALTESVPPPVVPVPIPEPAPEPEAVSPARPTRDVDKDYRSRDRDYRGPPRRDSDYRRSRDRDYRPYRPSRRYERRRSHRRSRSRSRSKSSSSRSRSRSKSRSRSLSPSKRTKKTTPPPEEKKESPKSTEEKEN